MQLEAFGEKDAVGTAQIQSEDQGFLGLAIAELADTGLDTAAEDEDRGVVGCQRVHAAGAGDGLGQRHVVAVDGYRALLLDLAQHEDLVRRVVRDMEDVAGLERDVVARITTRMKCVQVDQMRIVFA